MKAFLTSIIFALLLSGCAVNVYYLPPMGDASPTVPNITVDIVNPATPAPEPTIVKVPGPERVVKEMFLPPAVEELSKVKGVDKEMYRATNDEYGYVKALEKQAVQILELVEKAKTQKALSDEQSN